MPQLHIKLLSPLACGSGVGRPGIADRDVVFDEAGLPFIPGRRLKGLLRDAYCQVYELPAVAGIGLAPPEALFGNAGDERAGALVIGNARLPNAGELGTWLLSRAGSAIPRQDVMAHYTEVRRQTAISRDTGASDENTLRATRVLVPARCTFAAEIGPMGPIYKLALGVAAAALQQMGTGRTRGQGAVEVSLVDDAGDWKNKALTAIEAGTRLQGSTGPPVRLLNPLPSQQPLTLGVSPTYRLLYTIQLNEPALLPSMEGDPNTVSTEEYIPGGTMQGVLAAAYLHSTGANTEDFHRLFTTGNVLFLAAHPAMLGRRRTAAVPISLRRYKKSGLYVDLARQRPDADDAPKRVTGWTRVDVVQAGGTADRSELRIETAYHHQRAKDRRLGRSVGPEQARDFNLAAPAAGTLFTYESLAPGQVFMGALLGGQTDLQALMGLLPDGGYTAIGRSRSAQYGGKALWQWLDAAPQPLAGQESEVASWGQVRDSPSATVVVTLLAPLVGVSSRGNPAPVFPLEELREALGFQEGATLEIQSAHARQQWHASYLSHQRLPRQQMPALAPGSVFVIKLPAAVDEALMRAAERASYGMRIESGYGRISIRALTGVSGKLSNEYVPTAAASGAPVTQAVRELAEAVLDRRLKEGSDVQALACAEQKNHPRDPGAGTARLRAVSPHALHRVMAVVRRGAGIPEALEAFRDTAKSPLGRCFVTWPEGAAPMTLFDFVKDLAANPQTTYEKLADLVWRTAPWENILGTNPLLGKSEAYQKEKVLVFLRRYLEALAWHKRQPQ